MPKTQEEIIQQGYQALVASLGPVDAVRFLRHYSPGQGDYTQDRQQWQSQLSTEDVLSSIRSVLPPDPSTYTEIIE